MRTGTPSSAAAWADRSPDDAFLLSPDVAAALAALDCVADVLAGLDLLTLEGAQAAVITRRTAAATSRIAASSARMLPVVEADGRWALDGARSFGNWVAHRHHLSVHTARAQVRLGRALRDDLPLTAAAAAAGEITVEHAHVLANLAPTTQQRCEVLADPESEVNEAFLVHQARLMPPDHLRTVLRRWAAYTDPDADDRGYVEASDREHLEVDRLHDMYLVRGQLTVDHGQALKAALQAITPVPAAGDERTCAQRRAQALADLAQVCLARELAGKGRTVRPRINVLVSYEQFAALAASACRAPQQGDLGVDGPVRSPSFATAAMLTGEAVTGGPMYEDGTPIPRVVLDRVACTAGINRVIFGPQSDVIDVGRAERCFTGPRRDAIIARDKHCRYPGCTAPPVLCDCHHTKQWVRDHGTTKVTDGVLLCTFHHQYVHNKGIEIERRRDRWIFTDRHGREISTDGRQQFLRL